MFCIMWRSLYCGLLPKMRFSLWTNKNATKNASIFDTIENATENTTFIGKWKRNWERIFRWKMKTHLSFKNENGTENASSIFETNFRGILTRAVLDLDSVLN